MCPEYYRAQLLAGIDTVIGFGVGVGRSMGSPVVLRVRCIAMLHQQGWRGDRDTHHLFGYALQALRPFLNEHDAKLSPFGMHEAAKQR